MIVGTRLDEVPSYSINTRDLERRYPQIQGFYWVSSTTLENIPNLQEELLKVALSEPCILEEIELLFDVI
jgi:hypothetical protein